MIYVVQLAIVIAIAMLNEHYLWTDNGFIVAVWGLAAAYAVTVIPFQLLDWWKARHVRREIYATRAKMGLPSGWRRHLPGAYTRAHRRAVTAEKPGRNAFPE